jgi:hypothetical protein
MVLYQEVQYFSSDEGKSEELLGAGLPDEHVDVEWAKMNWVGYQRFVPKRNVLIR